MSDSIEITRYTPIAGWYDRSQKKYVTLRDIESLVLAGKDVRVRDSKSEEDLTGTILTQILLERHPERMRVFSVPFLHALLRADQMAIDWLSVYFGQAMSVMQGTSTTGLPGMELWKGMMPGATSRRGNEKEPPAAKFPSSGESHSRTSRKSLPKWNAAFGNWKTGNSGRSVKPERSS